MKIKYMGGADRRVLPVGEDFGGRLATPLAKAVEWNWAHRHTIDTDEASLPDEVIELILELDDFEDVSGRKVIPTNVAEQRWRGLPRTITEDTPIPEPTFVQQEDAEPIVDAFENLSEEELKDEARRLDVRGFSKMETEDLRAAVRQAHEASREPEPEPTS
jgi:hypothetical protein